MAKRRPITENGGQAKAPAMDPRFQLVAHLREGVMVLREGAVVFSNQAIVRIFQGNDPTGCTVAELGADPRTTMLAPWCDTATKVVRTGSVELPLQGHEERQEWSVEVIPLEWDGAPALQVVLTVGGAQHHLDQERTRSRMAEEVNTVLRQDIQEHRRTQDELRLSRRFSQSLVNSSLDMIIAVGREGEITEFNPAAMVRFGYELEEVLGRKARMLYGDDSEHKRIQVELNAHGAFTGEVRNIDRNGEAFTSFLTASRQYDEDGMLLGSMGVSRDITKAKRDELALRASEERYRDLFENATDLIQSVDPDGKFQYVNKTWCETLGYSKADLVNLTIWDVVAPEEQAACRQLFNEVLSGGSADQLRTVFLAKDGHRLVVEGNTNARIVDGRAIALRSIFRDVTGILAAKADLHRQEAKLRALFESSDHMFWTVDPRIALTGFNRGYADMIERLYGTRPEINTDLNKPRKRFASEGYHSFWEAKYAKAFSGKAIRFETDLKDRQGQRVCNEIFLSPVFDAEGRVNEVFGVGHEVTEQKEAEETVREQAARLAAIFESSANMMIWTLDSDFRITAFNDHFRRSTLRGMDLDLGLGDDFIASMMERVADSRYKPFVARYTAALAGEPQQFEVELRNRSGRVLWVENFLNPIRVDGKVVEVSCLAYGITDKKEAQRKLLESLHEKEVLLKEVHHRVKNNLQIISSILNLQGGYVDNDPRMLELLRESQGRIRSMSFIHESLYQNKNFSSIDLADYIHGLSRNLMHSHNLFGRVELVEQLEHVQLGLDQAIPCGLILNELISNAFKHAFPGVGKGVIELGLSCKDRTVRISVSDNGKGLPEGFEDERDANLGLQLVHTLIGQLDGHIARTKAPGVGYLITFEQPK